MRASRMFTALGLIGAAGVACKDNVTGIPAGLEVYTATLNGANEAPTPVTTTATGTAIITVLGNQVTWKVDITTAIDSIILGHIHRHAADSVAGNVQVNFNPAATGMGFTGTATVGSQANVADSILALMRAGRGYVNIHTKKHTGGEIRGTLVKQ
jgi:hypothetical protein